MDCGPLHARQTPESGPSNRRSTKLCPFIYGVHGHPHLYVYSGIRHIQPVVLSISNLLSQVPKYTIILESGESILPSKKEVFQCIVSTSTKSTLGESLAAHSMMHHVAP